MPFTDGFRPPAWLANRHVQSIFPSLPFRRPAVERRCRRLVAASQPLVLDCGEDVRLLALHATQERLGRPPARRLAVLLHGWEGSASSLYILSLGQLLLDAGFDVETNAAWLIDARGEIEVPLRSKRALAELILDRVAAARGAAPPAPPI